MKRLVEEEMVRLFQDFYMLIIKLNFFQLPLSFLLLSHGFNAFIIVIVPKCLCRSRLFHQ